MLLYIYESMIYRYIVVSYRPRVVGPGAERSSRRRVPYRLRSQPVSADQHATSQPRRDRHTTVVGGAVVACGSRSRGRAAVGG